MTEPQIIDVSKDPSDSLILESTSKPDDLSIKNDPSKSKQEFDLLVNHLSEMSKGFVDNTGKVAGFLLLALGWVVTSDDARKALESSSHIKYLAGAAVFVTFILSVGGSLLLYRMSETTIKRLDELSHLPRSSFDARKIRLMTFYVCVGGTGAIALLLIGVILNACAACTASAVLRTTCG